MILSLKVFLKVIQKGFRSAPPLIAKWSVLENKESCTLLNYVNYQKSYKIDFEGSFNFYIPGIIQRTAKQESKQFVRHCNVRISFIQYLLQNEQVSLQNKLILGIVVYSKNIY